MEEGKDREGKGGEGRGKKTRREEEGGRKHTMSAISFSEASELPITFTSFMIKNPGLTYTQH